MTGDARSDAATAAIRTLVSKGRYDDSWNLLRPQLLAGDTTTAWNVARQVLRACARAGWTPPTSRQIRLGVLCSYEAAEFSEHLRLACLARRINCRAVSPAQAGESPSGLLVCSDLLTSSFIVHPSSFCAY